MVYNNKGIEKNDPYNVSADYVGTVLFLYGNKMYPMQCSLSSTSHSPLGLLCSRLHSLSAVAMCMVFTTMFI